MNTSLFQFAFSLTVCQIMLVNAAVLADIQVLMNTYPDNPKYVAMMPRFEEVLMDFNKGGIDDIEEFLNDFFESSN